MLDRLELLPQFVADDVGRAMPLLRNARLVLAASGGGDSAALVSLLCEAGIAVSARCVVAHFDHRLRPAAESDAERDVARELAARYALPFAEGSWDQPHTGEAAARKARYAFLGTVASTHGAKLVVTGHTRDDQAETVLMRAMRGAGLHGLSGMAPIARWPLGGDTPLRVARPLFGVSRAQTRVWCKHRGLAFHDDPTNTEVRYARNRVRLELLPSLARAQPDIVEHLVALGDAARMSSRALDAAAAPMVTRHAAVVRIDRAALAKEPGLTQAALRIALERLLGDAGEFDRRHFAALARAAAMGATGTTLELPRGVIATIDPDAVLLSAGRIAIPEIEATFTAALPFEGAVGAWRLRVRRDKRGVVLPAASVVRRRRTGDRLMRPSGHHAKLQDHFVDRKVPRRLRDATPVIACGSDVLWTPWSPVARRRAYDGEAYVLDAQIESAFDVGVPLA